VVDHAFRWETSYRIIAARLPTVRIFEDLVDVDDLENVLAIEALTNPRLREAAATIALVEPADRITGPGASFVMAPFAYVRPGRFSPAGVRGVYYAGDELETAIAETTHHRARFLRETNEQPLIAEQRIIQATIEGAMLMVSSLDMLTRSRVLDPERYEASFVLGAQTYEAGDDGIVYPSVRRPVGQCVGAFRPRCVIGARTTGYLGYRWDGHTISDVFTIQSLTNAYPAEPGSRP